jgi:3-dehydroquinate synthase
MNTVQQLPVALGGRSYTIHIGADLLASELPSALRQGRRALLLTDEHVAAHYLPAALAAFGLNAEQAMVLPAGEPTKTWANAEQVLDWMLSHKLARDAVLIALGGGVIGDLAGFCAALYQRGIPFIQVPTTLLAMVDSSVGGKTGVNHPRGKNLIGAFHQPEAVMADLALLQTLPQREQAAGLAEVIKYGLLGDADFFNALEAQDLQAMLDGDSTTTARVVAHCCAMKARIVALDEHETISGGPRALLNLGHTFGHAVEAYAGYGQWLHGEAVGLGLVMAADLSWRHGWISAQALQRSTALVARAGLPVKPPAGMTPDDFRRLMAGDKKVAAEQLRLVLMKPLGSAVLTADFDDRKLGETLAHFCG